MDGEVTRGPDRGLPDRAAHEGRDRRRRSPGWRARCASSPPSADRRARICSTPPAPAATAAPSTSPPPRRWSRPARACGRQARQPLRHQPVRLRRRARGARRPHRPRPRRRRRAASSEAGIGFLFAPRTTRPCARGAGAPRARGAHDLQPARPADQPRRRPPPAHRRLRRALPARPSRARSRGWAWRARWSSRATTGSTRSRSPPPPMSWRSTARTSAATPSPPRSSGIAPASAPDPALAGRHARRERRRDPRDPRRRTRARAPISP